jgi:hypothetical protein
MAAAYSGSSFATIRTTFAFSVESGLAPLNVEAKLFLAICLLFSFPMKRAGIPSIFLR